GLCRLRLFAPNSGSPAKYIGSLHIGEPIVIAVRLPGHETHFDNHSANGPERPLFSVGPTAPASPPPLVDRAGSLAIALLRVMHRANKRRSRYGPLALNSVGQTVD